MENGLFGSQNQEEIEKHPFFIDGRNKNEKKINEAMVPVKVIKLNNFSVDLRAYCWTKGSDNAFLSQCDMLKYIKERFDEIGIEIPYPYCNILQK